jgi:hypothetical protein
MKERLTLSSISRSLKNLKLRKTKKNLIRLQELHYEIQKLKENIMI